MCGSSGLRTVQVLMTAMLFHLTNTLTGQLVVTGAGPEVITSTSMHYLGVVLDGKKPVILQYQVDISICDLRVKAILFGLTTNKDDSVLSTTSKVRRASSKRRGGPHNYQGEPFKARWINLHGVGCLIWMTSCKTKE